MWFSSNRAFWRWKQNAWTACPLWFKRRHRTHDPHSILRMNELSWSSKEWNKNKTNKPSFWYLTFKGWVFLYPVYTIQPVVKPVVKPDWQPVWQPCWTNSHCSFNRVERTATVRSTGCQTRLYNRFDNRLYTRHNRLSNRFDNRFANRLYRV